jgi:hypothetical protein
MWKKFNENMNNLANELLFILLCLALSIMVLYIISLFVIFLNKLKKDNDKFRAFRNAFKQLNANLFYFIKLKREINSVLNNRKELSYGLQNKQGQTNFKKIKLGYNWVSFEKDKIEIRLKPKCGISIAFFEDDNNRAIVRKIIALKYRRYDFSDVHGNHITYILSGRKK